MTKTLYQWKRLSLVEEEIPLPDQRSITHISIVHPGAAVILPLFDNGDILLLKQFRPSIKRWLYELPAGTMEAGEDPLQCAMRELEEETGYSAEHFLEMGELIPMAGFCDEVQHIYVAQSLNKTARYQCDDDEVIELESIKSTKLEQMIQDGTIQDAKTIATLFKAKICGYIK